MSFPTADPNVIRWCAVFFAIVFVVATCLSIYSLVYSNITGTAMYSEDVRGVTEEKVTRSASAEKFGQAIERLWMFTGLFFTLSWVSVAFARRLD